MAAQQGQDFLWALWWQGGAHSSGVLGQALPWDSAQAKVCPTPGVTWVMYVCLLSQGDLF